MKAGIMGDEAFRSMKALGLSSEGEVGEVGEPFRCVLSTASRRLPTTLGIAGDGVVLDVVESMEGVSMEFASELDLETLRLWLAPEVRRPSVLVISRRKERGESWSERMRRSAKGDEVKEKRRTMSLRGFPHHEILDASTVPDISVDDGPGSLTPVFLGEPDNLAPVCHCTAGLWG